MERRGAGGAGPAAAAAAKGERQHSIPQQGWHLQLAAEQTACLQQHGKAGWAVQRQAAAPAALSSSRALELQLTVRTYQPRQPAEGCSDARLQPGLRGGGAGALGSSRQQPAAAGCTCRRACRKRACSRNALDACAACPACCPVPQATTLTTSAPSPAMWPSAAASCRARCAAAPHTAHGWQPLSLQGWRQRCVCWAGWGAAAGAAQSRAAAPAARAVKGRAAGARGAAAAAACHSWCYTGGWLQRAAGGRALLNQRSRDAAAGRRSREVAGRHARPPAAAQQRRRWKHGGPGARSSPAHAACPRAAGRAPSRVPTNPPSCLAPRVRLAAPAAGEEHQDEPHDCDSPRLPALHQEVPGGCL